MVNRQLSQLICFEKEKMEMREKTEKGIEVMRQDGS